MGLKEQRDGILLFWMTSMYTISIQFQNVYSTGNVHIQFRVYACPQSLSSNSIWCESSSFQGKVCRPWVFFCLKEKSKGETCASRNYSIPLKSYCNATLSPLVEGENHFTLPFNGSVRRFDLFVSAGLNLGGQQQQETYESNIKQRDVVSLYPVKSSPEQSVGRLVVRHYELSFFVNAVCDQHYYADCDQYCEPDGIRCNCSKDETACGTTLDKEQSLSTMAGDNNNTTPTPTASEEYADHGERSDHMTAAKYGFISAGAVSFVILALGVGRYVLRLRSKKQNSAINQAQAEDIYPSTFKLSPRRVKPANNKHVRMRNSTSMTSLSWKVLNDILPMTQIDNYERLNSEMKHVIDMK